MERSKLRYEARVSLAAVLVLLFFFTLVVPPAAGKGWGDKFRSSVSRTTKNIRRSVNSARDNIRRRANRTRENIKRSVTRTQDKVRRSLNRTSDRVRQQVNRTSDRVRQRVDRTKRQVNERLQRERRRAEDFARRQAEQVRRNALQKQEKIRNAARRKKERLDQEIRKIEQFARGAIKKNGFARAVERVRKRSGETISRTIKRIHGSAGVQAALDTGRRYGQAAGAAVAAYLARSQQKGMQAVRRAQPLIAKISNTVRDPQIQRRLVLGAVAAAGAAYYAHSHKDVIKYRLINHVMESVSVPTQSGPAPLKRVVCGAILAHAPCLQGTSLAEDPAAVLSYGVVAVGKDDLMNKIAIVPDGRGNLRPVNAAIREVSGAEQAMSALQVSNSLEGMAMNAAGDGVFGVYGETFAGSYRSMEQKLGE